MTKKELLEMSIRGETTERSELIHHEKMTCNDELFQKELLAVVEDGAREE